MRRSFGGEVVVEAADLTGETPGSGWFEKVEISA